MSVSGLGLLEVGLRVWARVSVCVSVRIVIVARRRACARVRARVGSG